MRHATKQHVRAPTERPRQDAAHVGGLSRHSTSPGFIGRASRSPRHSRIWRAQTARTGPSGDRPPKPAGHRCAWLVPGRRARRLLARRARRASGARARCVPTHTMSGPIGTLPGSHRRRDRPSPRPPRSRAAWPSPQRASKSVQSLMTASRSAGNRKSRPLFLRRVRPLDADGQDALALRLERAADLREYDGPLERLAREQQEEGARLGKILFMRPLTLARLAESRKTKSFFGTRRVSRGSAFWSAVRLCEPRLVSPLESSSSSAASVLPLSCEVPSVGHGRAEANE